MIVLVKVGKQYKKIGKAIIHLKKKYFMGNSTSIKKWIQLELFTKNFEAMGHETLILSAMNNLGKIYMTAELKKKEIDESELRNKKHLNEYHDIYEAYDKTLKEDLKVLGEVKDKAIQNKTEKFKSIVEGNNEFLKNIKKMNQVNEEDLFEDVVDVGKIIFS